MKRDLTHRARRFIKQYVLNPSNATKAAELAGYSPRSARTIASRLLKDPRVQSELAKHFTDKEALIADILDNALLRLRQTLTDPDAEHKDVARAVRMALEYTKIAAGILGINVRQEKTDPTEDLTVDELIALHERELERLRRLASPHADSPPQRVPSETRAGDVQ